MSDEPLLLTPGPLTTSSETKEAMLRDWGSRDAQFIELTARVCQKLETIGGVDPDGRSHICVPILRSVTFAIDATIDTLVPRDGKVLVLINGAYGRRIANICEVNGRSLVTLETAEDTPPGSDVAGAPSSATAQEEETEPSVIAEPPTDRPSRRRKKKGRKKAA